jgi:hypothetical protein
MNDDLSADQDDDAPSIQMLDDVPHVHLRCAHTVQRLRLLHREYAELLSASGKPPTTGQFALLSSMGSFLEILESDLAVLEQAQRDGTTALDELPDIIASLDDADEVLPPGLTAQALLMGAPFKAV